MFEEAREKLRDACARVADVTKQVERMETAVSRADKAIEDAKAELVKHSGLDRDISKWRVTQVKKGSSTKILPENLKARLDARRAAEDELTQAEGTKEAIKDELAELRKRMDPAVKSAENMCATSSANMGRHWRKSSAQSTLDGPNCSKFWKASDRRPIRSPVARGRSGTQNSCGPQFMRQAKSICASSMASACWKACKLGGGTVSKPS